MAFERLDSARQAHLHEQIVGELEQGGQLYAVLDAARDRGVPDKLTELAIEHWPIFHRTPIPQDVALVLPYLAPCEPDSPLMRWVLAERWGDAWGLLVISSAPFERLYNHLCQHMQVELPTGERMIFRYYDPRVLETFLPSCDEEQSAAFFGPVRRFLCEAAADQSLLGFDPI